jgi:radical SAM superfamily enzyme YgiQ (UPF0313 family)
VTHPLEGVLSSVQAPQRYIGGEWNSHPHGDGARVALVYPDSYELGASNFGLAVVRHLLLSAGGFDVRRAFHPSPDMLALHRNGGIPWVDLEEGEPVSGNRVVGFSMASELLFTNMLNLVDLMGLPVRSSERAADSPIILAGGGGISNPVPLMPFVDAFFLGEAEAGAASVFRILAGGGTRAQRLERISLMEGVLVPGITPGRVRMARTASLADCPAPVDQIVPTAGIIQERAVVELARGCTRGCRFCQATQLSRPVRERSPECVASLMERALRSTGFEEGGVVTLSFSDYSRIEELSGVIARIEGERGVRISQPSLRPDTIRRLHDCGRRLKGKVTLAPEAGSFSLRKRIGKPFSDEDILDAVRAARAMGAGGVKMYFMVGLPWETDEDLLAISSLAERAASGGGRRWEVTAALSPFVPKPHTPFQWAAQQPPEEIRRRIRLVKGGCRRAKVSWNDPDTARVEAAIALGGDGFSQVLETAFRMGAINDAWNDLFRRDVWFSLLPAGPATPPAPGDELPWDVVDTGVREEWLREEFRRAEGGEPTPDCREAGCTGCGACDGGVPPLPSGVPAGTGPETFSADPACVRLRVRHSREGLARFTSHLDAVRMWGRVVRRAGVPVCMGAGYVRRPSIRFGYPLPLGMASRAEYVDLFLHTPMRPEEVAERLERALPEGFHIMALRQVSISDPSPDTGGILEFTIPGVETAILEGTPGVVRTGGCVVLVDPSLGSVRLDRLLAAAGVSHGVIERTEVYRRGEGTDAVPLLQIEEGEGADVNKG